MSNRLKLYELRIKEIDKEMVGVLNAISIISKRLADNIRTKKIEKEDA